MSKPSVNPYFAGYQCLDLTNKPWARGYDIEGDGAIGVEDMKAILYRPEDFPPIDQNERSLERACRQVKMGFWVLEARWLFRAIIAQQRPGDEQKKISLLDEAKKVETELLDRLHFFSPWTGDSDIFKTTKASIIEMGLRAVGILNGTLEEPFVTGINLAPFPSLDPWWPHLQVTGVHPYGGAAAVGIVPGDRIVRIGDYFISDWSFNETVDGLIDKETQSVRGLGGYQGTRVLLGVDREGDYFEVLVERNIWSGRVLGNENLPPAWDGQVANMPALTNTHQ